MGEIKLERSRGSIKYYLWVLCSVLLIYVLKMNRRIVGGIYQGYFEASNGNYSHLFFTFATMVFFFFLVSCLAANTNKINLFIHRDPFCELKIFDKTPVLMAVFISFIISATNDIFTFLGYTNKYFMVLKFFSFYMLLAYGTLCLCIYYSGRTSGSYCLRNAVQFSMWHLPYFLVGAVVLAGVAFGSMMVASKITGQNIILLEDYNILGLIKAVCITLSITLGVDLYKKSKIQKFCTNCA